MFQAEAVRRNSGFVSPILNGPNLVPNMSLLTEHHSIRANRRTGEDSRFGA